MISRISGYVFSLLVTVFIVAALAMPSVAAEPQWPPMAGRGGKGEARVLLKLDETTKLQFDGARLDEVLEYLKNLHGIPVALDKEALEALAITDESLVTIDIQGVSFRSGLRLMLRSIDPVLALEIRKGVLTITTLEVANEAPVERSYDVRALLQPGETAQPLAAALTRLYPRDEEGAAGDPEPAGFVPAAPAISARGTSILVRGTELQQESVVHLLCALKEQADAGNVKEH